MRLPLVVFSLISGLAACGGKSPAPTATPSVANTTGNATPTDGAPTTPTAPANDPAGDVCNNRPDEFGPVILTSAQVTTRYGEGATTFADAPSTKDKPIEVCGVADQHRWLMSVSCADGSKAFTNRGQAARSRTGNEGPGGRCGSIIDLYIAKCPEAEYQVHMDMYMCADGQSFM